MAVINQALVPSVRFGDFYFFRMVVIFNIKNLLSFFFAGSIWASSFSVEKLYIC